MVEVVEADLGNRQHVTGLLTVLDAYAREPQGGGRSLPAEVVERLPAALAEVPQALVLLALDDARVVGAAVSFFGFSTFAARPLLNLHDFAVLPECRGRGIGSALLAALEDRARRRNCCKVTLEVLDSNVDARRLYARRGFGDYQPGDDKTPTLFLQKSL